MFHFLQINLMCSSEEKYTPDKLAGRVLTLQIAIELQKTKFELILHKGSGTVSKILNFLFIFIYLLHIYYTFSQRK